MANGYDEREIAAGQGISSNKPAPQQGVHGSNIANNTTLLDKIFTSNTLVSPLAELDQRIAAEQSKAHQVERAKQKKIIDRLRLDSLAAQERTGDQIAGDLANAAAVKGSIMLGEMAYGTANLVTGGLLDKGIDSATDGGFNMGNFGEAREVADDLFSSRILKASKERAGIMNAEFAAAQEIEKERRAANGEAPEGFISEQLDAAGNAIKTAFDNPAATIDTIAESALGMVGGGATGKVAINKFRDAVLKKATAKGTSKAAAERYIAKESKRIGAATGVGYNVVMEGATNAVGAAGEILKMGHAELMAESPAYKQMIENGMSTEDARRKLADQTFMSVYAIAGGIGGFASKLTGAASFEGNLFNPGGRLASKFLQYTVKKGVTGAVTEGAEEFVQSGGGRFAENVASKYVQDKDIELSEGVGEAAGTGLVAGVASGGSLGAITSRPIASVVSDTVKLTEGALKGANNITEVINKSGYDKETKKAIKEENYTFMEPGSDNYNPVDAAKFSLEKENYDSIAEAYADKGGKTFVNDAIHMHLSYALDDLITSHADNKISDAVFSKKMKQLNKMQEQAANLNTLSNTDTQLTEAIKVAVNEEKRSDGREKLKQVLNSGFNIDKIGEAISIDDAKALLDSNLLTKLEIRDLKQYIVEKKTIDDVRADVLNSEGTYRGVHNYIGDIQQALKDKNIDAAIGTLQKLELFAEKHREKLSTMNKEAGKHVPKLLQYVQEEVSLLSKGVLSGATEILAVFPQASIKTSELGIEISGVKDLDNIKKEFEKEYAVMEDQLNSIRNQKVNVDTLETSNKKATKDKKKGGKGAATIKAEQKEKDTRTPLQKLQERLVARSENKDSYLKQSPNYKKIIKASSLKKNVIAAFAKAETDQELEELVYKYDEQEAELKNIRQDKSIKTAFNKSAKAELSNIKDTKEKKILSALIKKVEANLKKKDSRDSDLDTEITEALKNIEDKAAANIAIDIDTTKKRQTSANKGETTKLSNKEQTIKERLNAKTEAERTALEKEKADLNKVKVETIEIVDTENQTVEKKTITKKEVSSNPSAAKLPKFIKNIKKKFTDKISSYVSSSDYIEQTDDKNSSFTKTIKKLTAVNGRINHITEFFGKKLVNEKYIIELDTFFKNEEGKSVRSQLELVYDENGYLIAEESTLTQNGVDVDLSIEEDLTLTTDINKTLKKLKLKKARPPAGTTIPLVRTVVEQQHIDNRVKAEKLALQRRLEEKGDNKVIAEGVTQNLLEDENLVDDESITDEVSNLNTLLQKLKKGNLQIIDIIHLMEKTALGAHINGYLGVIQSNYTVAEFKKLATLITESAIETLTFKNDVSHQIINSPLRDKNGRNKLQDNFTVGKVDTQSLLFQVENYYSKFTFDEEGKVTEVDPELLEHLGLETENQINDLKILAELEYQARDVLYLLLKEPSESNKEDSDTLLYYLYQSEFSEDTITRENLNEILPENFITSMVHSGFNAIAELQGSLHNDADSINSMLGNGDAPLKDGAHKVLGFAGKMLKHVSRNIGRNVVSKQWGIVPKNEADITDEAALHNAVGHIVIAMLAEMDYVQIHSIEHGVLDSFRGTPKGGSKTKEISFVRLRTVSKDKGTNTYSPNHKSFDTPTEDMNLKNMYRYGDDIPLLGDFIQYLDETREDTLDGKNILASVLPTSASAEVQVRFTPDNSVDSKLRRGTQEIPREKKQTLKLLNELEHIVNTDMLSLMDTFGENLFKQIAGYVTPDADGIFNDGYIGEDETNSIAGKNLSIEREIEHAQKVIQSMKTQAEAGNIGLNEVKIYFDNFVGKNNRIMVKQNTVNRVGSIFHRMLFDINGAVTEIIPDGKTEQAKATQRTFFTTVASAFGIDTKPTGFDYEAAVAKLTGMDLTKAELDTLRESTDPADIELHTIATAINYLRMQADGKTIKDADASNIIAEAVDILGDEFESLRGLIELANFKNAQKAKASFESRMLLEVDGIANGIAISLTQFVSEMNQKTIFNLLQKVGIYTDDKYKHHGDFKNTEGDNNEDIYQALLSIWDEENTETLEEFLFYYEDTKKHEFSFSDSIEENGYSQRQISAFSKIVDTAKKVGYKIKPKHIKQLHDAMEIIVGGIDRDSIKYPVMIKNYEGGLKKIMDAFSLEAIQDLEWLINRGHTAEYENNDSALLARFGDNSLEITNNILDVLERFGIFEVKGDSTLKEITKDNAAEFKFTNKQRNEIKTILNAFYGQGLESALNQEQEQLSQSRKKTTSMINIMANIYINKFNAGLNAIVKTNQGPPTLGQYKNLLAELKEFSPLIHNYFSKLTDTREELERFGSLYINRELSALEHATEKGEFYRTVTRIDTVQLKEDGRPSRPKINKEGKLVLTNRKMASLNTTNDVWSFVSPGVFSGIAANMDLETAVQTLNILELAKIDSQKLYTDIHDAFDLGQSYSNEGAISGNKMLSVVTDFNFVEEVVNQYQSMLHNSNISSKELKVAKDDAFLTEDAREEADETFLTDYGLNKLLENTARKKAATQDAISTVSQYDKEGGGYEYNREEIAQFKAELQEARNNALTQEQQIEANKKKAADDATRNQRSVEVPLDADTSPSQIINNVKQLLIAARNAFDYFNTKNRYNPFNDVLILLDNELISTKDKKATIDSMVKKATRLSKNWGKYQEEYLDKVLRVINKAGDIHYGSVLLPKLLGFKTNSNESTLASSYSEQIDINNFKAHTSVTVTGGNLNKLFNQIWELYDDGIPNSISNHHKGYLAGLVNGIGKNILDPFQVHLENRGTSNTGQINLMTGNVYISGLNRSRAGIATPNMSAAEVFAHELVHKITHFVLGPEGSSAYARRVKQIYSDLQEQGNNDPDNKHKLFMPAGISKSHPHFNEIEKNAKLTWEYVFGNLTETTSVTRIDPITKAEYVEITNSGIQEFMAYAMTNENFRKQLRGLKLPKSQFKQGTTLIEKVIGLWDDIVNFLFNKLNESDESVGTEIDALYANLVAVGNEHKTKLNNVIANTERAIAGGINLTSKIVGTPLSKLAEAGGKLENELTKTIDNAVNNPEGLEYGFKRFFKEFGEALERAGVRQDSLIMGTIHEIIGATARNKFIAAGVRETKHVIDKIRRDMKKAVMEVIRESFRHSDNNKLSKESKEALGYMLSADTQFLLHAKPGSLVNKYSAKNIEKIFKDKATRDAYIKEVEAIIYAKYGKTKANKSNLTVGTYYANMARNLGHYQIHKESLLMDVRVNAKQIANLSNTSMKTIGNIDTAERLIDELASLYAIDSMYESTRNHIASIMEKENSVDSNNNGITVALKMHQTIHEEAKDDLFHGKSEQMMKGYTRDITDPNVTVTMAPVGDKQAMAKQNYKFSHRVHKDAVDFSNSGDTALYYSSVLTDNGWNPQWFNLTAEKSAGTTLYEAFKQSGKDLSPKQVRQAMKKVRKQKLGLAHKIASTDFNNLQKPDSAVLVPTIDDEGNVRDYRYIMTESNRRNILKKDTSIDTVLGMMAGNIKDKLTTKKLAKKAVAQLKEHYSDTYAESPGSWVTISAASAEEKHREIWRMLPKDTRQEAINQFGAPEIIVRSRDVSMIFGQRTPSVANLAWKETEYAEDMELVKRHINNAFYTLLNNQTGQFIEGTVVALTSALKDTIVIKFGTTLMFNILSNMYLLRSMGVPFSEIVKGHGKAMREGVKYHKDEMRLRKLQYKYENDPKFKRDSVAVKINQLAAELSANPIAPLIRSHTYQSIIEDVDIEDDQFSYGSRVQSQLMSNKLISDAVGKIPDKLKRTGEYAVMAHNTGLYKAMRDLTQLSDFAGRYILHGHNLKRGITPEASHQMIMDAFIDYDPPTHSVLHYLNNIGGVMFTKFVTRIQSTLVHSVLGQSLEITPKEAAKRKKEGKKVFERDGKFYTRFNNLPNVVALGTLESFVGDLASPFDEHILTAPSRARVPFLEWPEIVTGPLTISGTMKLTGLD